MPREHGWYQHCTFSKYVETRSPPETPRFLGSGDVFSLALVIVCLGWMKHAPPKDHDPLGNNWASVGMYSVLSRCLQHKQRDRWTLAELPRYVW
jgi:hypothetical protein